MCKNVMCKMATSVLYVCMVFMLCMASLHGFVIARGRAWHLQRCMTSTEPSLEKQIDIVADQNQAKQRLDALLASLDKSFSRSFFGNLCDHGAVTVNGKVQDKAYKVRLHDRIQCRATPKPSLTVEPEEIPLDILYEDEHVLAVNKPNGMVVHPAVGSPNGTFANALLHHLGQNVNDWLTHAASISAESAEMDAETEDFLSEELEDTSLPETPEAARATPSAQRPGIVHRLDKGTTGVLLAAKNPSALGRLSRLFAKREVSKVYISICVGHPGDTTIATFLARSPKNRQIMSVVDGPPGKPAVTHTRTLAFDGQLSVVLLRIETGRTHQIRIHLQHRRTPILGDETYGTAIWNQRYFRTHNITRPLLHAYETSFVHPITGERLSLRAPIPSDMKRLIEKIQKSPLSLVPSTVAAVDLLDDTTGLLRCSTEVEGKGMATEEDGEDFEFVSLSGGTPIRRMIRPSASSSSSAATTPKFYVPSDRLKVEEEDWMKVDLPEDATLFTS